MQDLMGVRSVLKELTSLGRLVDAVYEQPESVGDVRQLLTVVMSVVSVVQVVWSHFPVSTLGSVVAAEYAVVQALAVGSVMHSLRGVSSPLKELTRAGRLVAAV